MEKVGRGGREGGGGPAAAAVEALRRGAPSSARTHALLIDSDGTRLHGSLGSREAGRREMMLTMTFGARLYGTYFTVILYTQLSCALW